MRLLYKLLLAMLVPVALIWAVGYYAVQVSQRSLREAIEATSAAQARSVMNEIDRGIHTRIANWEAYARSDLVRDTLAASNSQFNGLDNVTETIAERDLLWQATPADSPSPLMLQLMDNPLARDLTRRLDKLEEASGYRVFGEVFITNRFGANAAQTDRTTDYRQNDEAWWLSALRDGTHVSDVSFDESAGIYSVDICLRIDGEDGQMIGVLKAVLNIEEAIRVIEAHSWDDPDQSRRGLLLFSGERQLISAGLKGSEPLEDGSEYFHEVEFASDTNDVAIERIDAATCKTLLVSYARSRGYADFPGLGWTVMVQHWAGDVFAPVVALRRNILLIALAATALAALVSGTLAMSISRRVKRVAVAAEAIGRGKLDFRIAERGTDEVAKLATGFNRMASQLKTSDDKLRKTHQKLIEAKNGAEAANRAKGSFLANMSHEIRTPLNAVIGMTDLMRETALTAQQSDYLESVNSAGESLLALVNDILDFSKIEASHLRLENAVIDHTELLEDTVKSMGQHSSQKGLELTCRISPDIPTMLIGDATRLRQVLLNLIGNAIKFTERGEISVDVEIEDTLDGAVVLQYLVTDTGIGIPNEKLESMFYPFEQADLSTTRRFGGTGLGLAICSRLVEMMGGHIWAESQEGEGSTFHFTAKFAVPSEQPPAIPQIDADALRGMPILVVDDNETNRRLLEELTAKWGMTPTTVEGAEQALLAMRRAIQADRPFRLVLTDANMPGTDGFQLVRNIKDSPQHSGTIIMMLSSGERPEDRRQCQDLEIAAYLTKPIKQSEMLDAILSSLGANQHQQPTRKVNTYQPPSMRPLHILAAEDSIVNQKLVVGLLSKYGHCIDVANNGREAFEMWQQGEHDLLLMDVQMPEMNGLEATRRIRAAELETGKHIPIVAMTAHAMTGDRERCLEAGMDEYVSKPIRHDKLFLAISSLLEVGADGRSSEAHSSPATEQATTTIASTASPIDWPVALETAYGDRELLRELAQASLEETELLLQQMRTAIAEGDAVTLRRAAHTMKGQMRIFGTEPVEQVAQAIEHRARNGDTAQNEPTTELQEYVKLIQAELQAYLDGRVEIPHEPA